MGLSFVTLVTLKYFCSKWFPHLTLFLPGGKDYATHPGRELDAASGGLPHPALRASFSRGREKEMREGDARWVPGGVHLALPHTFMPRLQQRAQEIFNQMIFPGYLYFVMSCLHASSSIFE